MATYKTKRRQGVRYRIRKKISGTNERPRLSVFRSNRGIYAQLIDDQTGSTLASSSTKQLKLNSISVENSTKVGEDLAKKAIAGGYEACVFDRGGYLFHGNVKALADGARKGGLKF